MVLPEIQAQLSPDHPWRNQIRCFDCIPSTNDLAKELARKGAPEGTVLIADRQTLGRGRLGRSFHSPAGAGIYMSVILRPQCKPGDLMHLTCAVGQAMCNAVEEATGIRPGIKWINDLVWERKKLGGILVELLLTPQGGLDSAIVGIGINCAQKAEDFPPELSTIATSLAIATGRIPDRVKLAAAMIAQLHGMSGELLAEQASMLAQYRGDCVTIGQEVVLIRGNQRLSAHAIGVDNSGALLLRYPSGETEAVQSGEVSVRGMYGYV